ncbi:MAG: hypothetical protein L0154_05090 [Chloroflexi bacterium]|nr:hypothetical protein [Chloroflexota bacterium]
MSLISRRQFLASLATVSTAIGLPQVQTAFADEQVLEITETIRTLENRMREFPAFDYGTHNDLRHYYLPISVKRSRLHCDIIFQNWFMDNYVLQTLSDWCLEHGDRAGAIALLLENAETYGYLPHLRAACTLKAGDLFRSGRHITQAKNLYQNVVETTERISLDTIRPYHRAAMLRAEFNL